MRESASFHEFLTDTVLMERLIAPYGKTSGKSSDLSIRFIAQKSKVHFA